jgi:hypothetical protein
LKHLEGETFHHLPHGWRKYCDIKFIVGEIEFELRWKGLHGALKNATTIEEYNHLFDQVKKEFYGTYDESQGATRGLAKGNQSML